MTRALQPYRPVGLPQGDDPLGGAEIVQDAAAEEPLDEFTAGRADRFGLSKAPLGVPEFVRHGLGRHVVIDRGALAGAVKPRMAGHERQVVIELDRGVRGLEPQLAADELKRHRVIRLLELDMAVAVDLDVGPGGDLDRDCRQGPQHRLLRLGKEHQRLLAGRAVDAVSGRLQAPSPKLPVGVGQGPEVAQGDEGALDVLHAALDAPFLLGIPRRARRDQKPVAFGQLRIGALNLRVVNAGTRYGALEVVDDPLAGDAAEGLEGAAVTGKPGRHVLVRDDLGVDMTAEAQGHHEDPRLPHDAREGVQDIGPLAEVDLGGFPGLKLQHAAHLRLPKPQAKHQTTNGRVAASKAEPIDQGPVDRRHAHTLLDPLPDLLRKGKRQGHMGGIDRRLDLEGRRQGLIVGQRLLAQPAVLLGDPADLLALAAAHQLRQGDRAVALAHAHAVDHVSVLVHLEPPVAHVHAPPGFHR